MKIIDFDARFRAYLEGWMRENAGKYRNMDQMEAKMPEVYLRFINERADWLQGVSPAEFFARMDSAQELVQALSRYEEAGVAIPDLLLERIVELGEPAVSPLMAMAENAENCACLRATALNLLIELGAEEPMEICLRLVNEREEEDEVADVAAELLEALGDRAVPEMLKRLERASDAALVTYLDLLCNFPGDERIYTYTVREFLNKSDQRALFASYLGKLGDARAIEPLKKVVNLSDINYLDYLEIANAIEVLGGEVGDRSREFPGDPYYESLKGI